MEIKGFTGTVSVINDTQNPFHDSRVLHEVELFLSELQPDIHVNLGDMGDFYGISSFDKNPARADRMQEDLNSTKRMHTRQRKVMPNTRILEEDGNHEDRLRRYLWSKAPALASLDCLTIDKLYGLSENDIEHVDYEEGIRINGIFTLLHGELIRAHSSYTAKGMQDKHGGCGMSAHTHRGGVYYKTDRSGVYGWWENFCLCNLHPDWIRNPNWQQGFSLIHFTKDRFWVEQCQVINKKFVYGGKVYGSGGKKR